jgi:hypothetical protein
MGISDAREAAGAMRAKVQRDGVDPVAEARRKRSAARDAGQGVGTLAALLDLYGSKAGAKLKSWPKCRRHIEHVFAVSLTKPLTALKADELQFAADAHPSAQSAASAVRYIRPVLKWGAQRRYVTTDTAILHPPATVGRRDRVLSRDELAALLPVLAQSANPYARALQFMLWTLARREEVGQARWRDGELGRGDVDDPGHQERHAAYRSTAPSGGGVPGGHEARRRRSWRAGIRQQRGWSARQLGPGSESDHGRERHDRLD